MSAGPAPALVVIDQDKALLEVKGGAAGLLSQAKDFVVRPATREAASALLITIANARRRAEDRRKAIVDPHVKYQKRINDFVRDLIAPLVEADAILRNKVREFIRQEEFDAAEAAAAARRAELQKEALATQAAEAEAAGDIATAAKLLDEAVAVEGQATQLQTFADAAPPVERTVRPASGGLVGARKHWTFEVLEVGKVPEEYLKPREVDGVKVRGAIAAGLRPAEDGVQPISGLRIFEDDQLQVRG